LAGKDVTVGPHEGERVAFPSFAVTFKIEGAHTRGAFSVIEYEVQPRALIFPHVHSREDETSYVIAGEIGVRVGDHEELVAAGGYVRKPRMVPHTFWNPTDGVARVLEIISPAGFEAYFRETTPLFDESGKPDLAVITAMSARYGNGADMGQVAWISGLMQRYHLRPRADHAVAPQRSPAPTWRDTSEASPTAFIAFYWLPIFGVLGLAKGRNDLTSSEQASDSREERSGRARRA
jgi:quercetin dioxygenase-like cupin family protein